MIIITGGAGFIGSALAAELNARGVDEILIVDLLGTHERWKNLRKLRYFDYMEADDFAQALDSDQVEWDVEAILHMGACSDTTETDASYLVHNNYEYTKMLAQWAVDHQVRFIYASSAATYGDGSAGFSDSDPIEPLIPLNMYGYSKQMFDLWAKRTGIADQIVGLKYFNVFGPNEYHKGEMRSFVLKAFEQINAGGGVRLFKSHRPDYADGMQLRDFLYIKDAVDMTLSFLENSEINGIFNIGTGKARSWLDLAGAVFAAMNKTPRIEFIPMPEKLRDKYQYFTQADISKLRDTGYRKNTTDLELAVTDYVQNYLMKGEYLGAE
jgi:ADP-L-glycero-D-manno-heptose 6-epimerase